ncbi:hypothetical protein BC835DRAFT_1272470 [Cytidiella melzeri]|nr:hypothetical protein BC835DRAFT_1272470 [Cytidiella melzeri]
MGPGQQQPPMVSNVETQMGSQYQAQLLARCARGEHDVEKKYGPCGIITAVICFPIGLIALFIDVERKCSRCGVRLEH